MKNSHQLVKKPNVTYLIEFDLYEMKNFQMALFRASLLDMSSSIFLFQNESVIKRAVKKTKSWGDQSVQIKRIKNRVTYANPHNQNPSETLPKPFRKPFQVDQKKRLVQNGVSVIASY